MLGFMMKTCSPRPSLFIPNIISCHTEDVGRLDQTGLPTYRPPPFTRINSFKSPYGSKLDYINNLPNGD